MKTEFDLNLLRLLLVLDGTRSVTQAARALDMSQSGFSSAMARLRRSIGDPLFVRTSQGMEPTPRASQVLKTAESVLAQVDRDILEEPGFDPAKRGAVFQLAMADVAEVAFLPRLLRYLHVHTPHCSLQSDVYAEGGLRDALESGQVDLAIGYFPDLSGAPFFQQRLVMHTYVGMLRKGHPAARKKLDLCTYKELGHAVVTSPSRSAVHLETVLEELGVVRRIVLRTRHHLSLPAIVDGTDLIASVPLATAAPYVAAGVVDAVALPFTPPFFPVTQVWHRRTHQDFRLRWLQAQVSRLFNDRNDAWHDLERKLYGDIRPTHL